MRHQWSSVPMLLIVVLQLCAASGTALSAAPPSMEEIRQAWSEAVRPTMEVEGEYKFYRAEKFVREALSRPPAEAGIPFTRDGYLWRSRDRFRTNYTLYNSVSQQVSRKESLATDGEMSYQFVGRNDPLQGTLGIFNAGTQHAAGLLNTVKSEYHKALNCTWGDEGGSFSRYLQMPDAQIATLDGDEEGFAMSLRHEPTQSEAEFHFMTAPGFPLKYMRTKSGSVQIELQVVSKVVGGVSLPKRYVEAISFGTESAYTFVAELDLKPLQPDSPIAKPIDKESFRDLGIVYVVEQQEQIGADEDGAGTIPGTDFSKVVQSDGIAGVMSHTWRIMLCLTGLAVVLCYAWIRYNNRVVTMPSQPVEEYL